MKNSLLVAVLLMVSVTTVRAKTSVGVGVKTRLEEKKVKLLERTNKRLCEVNKNRTTAMEKKLTRMQEIVNKLKGEGVDTTAAQAAIDAALSAVTTQSEVACGTDGQTRAEVKAAIESEKSGLKNAYEKLLSAKKAVEDAVKSWKTRREATEE